MYTERGDSLLKKITKIEFVGFLIAIVLSWTNEALDLPHMFAGAEPTPVNYRECIIETAYLSLLGSAIILVTAHILRRTKHLEGFYTICASCKKVKNSEGNWIPIDDFLLDTYETNLSHSLCPQCLGKTYPPDLRRHT